jgi:alpha-L-rhamnosidase
MMKLLLKTLVLPLWFVWFKGVAQAPAEWNAHWITHPNIALSEHAVVHFRKNFELKQVPKTFVIHVSADNHYRLFVNGKYLSRGPARGDIDHWFYETIDIAPFLKTGDNVIAAEVINWGPKRSFTYFSQITGLLIQGNSPAESAINTFANQWKTYHNTAYKPVLVDWIYDKTTIDFGLYVCNPTDQIDGQLYPWNWEKNNYNDSSWANAKWADISGAYGTQHAGGILYGNGKTLVPRNVGMLHERDERLAKIARITGTEKTEDFLHGKTWVVAPKQKVTLLIDAGHETIGYPEIRVSKGKDAKVRLMYAENLIYKNKGPKNDRNDINNKYLVGIKDTYFLDGGAQRVYKPSYLRAFRFIEMAIETADEPLEIHDLKNILCTAPISLKASFESDSPKLNRLMTMGWQTASICAQDILMSDAAYEQMQYTGDSRVHNLSLLAMSGDDRLTRNFLTQIDQSRIPEGLTYACYPNAFHLIIPSYSLIWVDQIHDYMIWKDDKAFIGEFDLGIKSVMHWYESRLDKNGLLGNIEWWPALAWPRHYKNGMPPGIVNDNNTLYSLHLAYTMKHVAEIYSFLGKTNEAVAYTNKAKNICQAVNKYCKTKDGFYKESPKVDSVSQITNILAILAGAVEGNEAKTLMKKLLEPKDWFGQVDVFLHLYLFEALNKTELREYFEEELSEWYLMQERNMSTFAEVPLEWGEENQRSECHPWSTAPNYFIFRTLCGIKPLAPGHKKMSIAPNFGKLTKIKAVYPHYLGNINLNLERKGKQVFGTVEVPKTTQATFVWDNKQIILNAGVNVIDLGK